MKIRRLTQSLNGPFNTENGDGSAASPSPFPANFLASFANDCAPSRRRTESTTPACCEHRDHQAAGARDRLAADLRLFTRAASNQRAVTVLWKHSPFYQVFLGYQRRSSPHWQAIIHLLTPIVCVRSCEHTPVCAPSLSRLFPGADDQVPDGILQAGGYLFMLQWKDFNY